MFTKRRVIMKKEEKKSILVELAAKITESNEAFTNMTKAEKRVEVAKDLIVRLNIDQIKTTANAMMRFKINGLLSSEQTKNILNKVPDTVCEVCAKGGLFMAYIGRVNKETVSSAREATSHSNLPSSRGNKKLAEIFSMRQISAIEFAYEGVQFLKTDGKGRVITFSKEEVESFKAFRKSHRSRKERLIAIAQNIIDNKGTFKP